MNKDTNTLAAELMEYEWIDKLHVKDKDGNNIVYEWIDKLHVKDKDGNNIVDGTEWRPIEDIAQAMVLVEIAAKKTGWFNLAYNPEANSLAWDASFIDDTERGCVYANTPAEAITLAAIEAMKP